MSDPTTESMERMAKLYSEMSERATHLATENAILEARVRALESQLLIVRPIDPDAHAVYREAAVMLSTYVSGALESPDQDVRRRMARSPWRQLAERVEQHLRQETEH